MSRRVELNRVAWSQDAKIGRVSIKTRLRLGAEMSGCLSVKEAGCQDVKGPGCQGIMDKRRLRLRAKNIVVA